jgi:hypothetical protein
MSRQRHLSLALVAALTLALCACGSRSASPEESYAATLNAGGLQPAQIIDATLQMPAANIQIPAGWQITGGVNWNEAATCFGNRILYDWAALAPDGRTGVGQTPGSAWHLGSESLPDLCPAAPFLGAREYLEANIKRLQPDAQVVKWTDHTQGLQQALRQQSTCTPQFPKPAPIQDMRVDAAQVLLHYTENGVRMKQVLYASASFIGTSGAVSAITFARAPENMPDKSFDALVKRILETGCWNRQWMQAATQRVWANVQR